MTLRHLEIFIKVYELQSITKAAEALHIAQPSISLAVKELENEYQVCLFDRMSRRIYPTKTADQLYEYAVHLMTLFSEMDKHIKQWEATSKITLGSSITISNMILPDLLKQFKQDNPETDFKVYINNCETIEEMIIENKIDFALIENEPVNENIIRIPFMSDRLATIVANHHPLCQKDHPQLNDLLSYPFLMRESGSSVYNLVQSIFASHQINIKAAMESASTQAIIRCVESGLGISTLPYTLVKKALQDKTVSEIAIPELNITRKYNIIYHKNKYISESAKAFFDLCLHSDNH